MNSDFYRQVEAIGDSLPPVESWDPALSGDMDCQIKRDGSWWLDQEPLKNARLQRLFSTILKREKEDYFLVTPVEKWRIKVEDLPFMIVELDIFHKGTTEQLIELKTNVGDSFSIDSEHIIDTSQIPGLEDDQAIPFVRVRSNLMARFNRNTYLSLADFLDPLPHSNQYSLISANTTFTLSF